jgi:hypothetical protein
LTSAKTIINILIVQSQLSNHKHPLSIGARVAGLLKVGMMLVVVFVVSIKAFPDFMRHSKYGLGVVFTSTGVLSLADALLFEQTVTRHKPYPLTGAAGIWFLLLGLIVLIYNLFH